MNKTNVIVLMHDTLKGLGLKHVLEDSFNVAVTIAHGVEAIESMGENVDYIFTDLLTYASSIKFFIPRQSKTIVVSDHTTADNTSAMLCSCDDLDTIIDTLGHFFAHHDNDSAGSDGILSARETDVLRLVASGLINKEIAEQLNISINTVLTHRKNITAKLGIKSASGLSFYALMNGIIAPK